MLNEMLPSSRLSSTPVTVTVCGVLQFADVNVSEAGLTVPSVVSLELTAMVTSAVGWLSSTTVKVAVPPASVVVNAVAGVTDGGGNTASGNGNPLQCRNVACGPTP